ncbi:DNA repair protein XRCC3 isoform X2 [Lingula anatina]|nr:DNA repair protein XRCC3 isoform X2 [Lingula anatina]|eukprot:XP_013387995.1 DNA repair protein XRCC3 isoform X2 [Lingula anatina]
MRDVHMVHREVAKAVKKPAVISALELSSESCPDCHKIFNLSTGDGFIDKLLRGGILSKGITEVAGASATGKTQFCIQLCLTVQLPRAQGGLGGGAVYICTEDVFPTKRLQQMIGAFCKTIDKEFQKIQFGDQIFIEHIAEKEDLISCLKYRLPKLLQKNIVKLVVIDSVAALFRSEYHLSESTKRSKQLSSLGAILHELSSSSNIPVVCVNQVSDVINPSAKSHGKQVTPSLGLTWANLVTTRLMLTRTIYNVTIERSDTAGKVLDKYESAVRKLEAVFAPHLQKDCCHFVISSDGVKGILIQDTPD